MLTYGELKTAFNDTMSRTDLDPARFVRMVEKDINRRLRTTSVEASLELTLTDNEADLPTGFVQARSVKTDEDGGVVLSPLDTLQADRHETDTAARGYVIEGEKIRIVPAASGTVTMKYFGTLVGLSSDADSNEILLEHPDVYLYGACMHAHVVTQDAEELAKFAQLYEVGMGGLEDWLLLRRFPTGLQRLPA